MPNEPEATSGELPERAKSRWIIEIDQKTPLADAGSEDAEDSVPDTTPRWMIVSSFYDDRDRALRSLAFRQRKYPDETQRFVRIEERHHIEDVEPEELQEFHDQATQGDADKAARG